MALRITIYIPSDRGSIYQQMGNNPFQHVYSPGFQRPIFTIGEYSADTLPFLIFFLPQRCNCPSTKCSRQTKASRSYCEDLRSSHIQTVALSLMADSLGRT